MGKLRDLAVLAASCGVIYVLLNWESLNPGTDDAAAFAERACADRIEARYAAQSVNTYGLEKSTSGYIVRASATMPRGRIAKVTCLANSQGGVDDLEIEER